MNILITGGAGFIGTHLRKKLAGGGHRVVIFDNLLAQVHGENPPARFDDCDEFIRGDVRDIDAVRGATKGADVVFHLAAETGVGQSQYEIERYVSTNTLGTAAVLQAAAEEKVKQVVITSSRAVYGEGLHKCPNCKVEYVPEPRAQADLDAGRWEVFCPTCGGECEALLMEESAPPMPTSVYGLTKLQQEQLARQVGQIYGLPVTLLRPFNVFGPGQSLGNPYVGVLGTFFRRIMSGGGIDIYEDGQMRRDFVYVGDVVEVLNSVAGNEAAFNKTLNVGTGAVVTLEAAGAAVFDVLGREPQMSFSGKYRLGDIHHAVGDMRLLGDTLGFVPRVSFADGLKRYLDWAQENDADFANIDAAAERQLAEKNLLRQGKNG